MSNTQPHPSSACSNISCTCQASTWWMLWSPGRQRPLPAGQGSRSDHPESLRDRILYIGEINYPTAQAMLHAVQTGKPAFENVFGVPLFEYLARRPNLGSIFNHLMSEDVSDRAAGIVDAYDFSDAMTIVDVGGGSGTLLAAILRACPRAKGILFDSFPVIAEARESLGQADLASRIELME